MALSQHGAGWCTGKDWKPGKRQRRAYAAVATNASRSLSALLWDIDGVILESEDLHRQAYNEAFKNHGVTSPQTGELVQWSTELYDEMSNSIGGGKPKMRWFFTERDGLPTSNSNAQSNEELIDLIQEEKNEVYQSIIASGAVSPRPGVLNIMDEAFALGIPMALCSASTRSSAEQTVKTLLGEERVQKMACFLAGDDVGDAKKPDPTIYKVALDRLDITDPSNVLVIEDSTIGVNAAIAAGCRCLVTYTRTGVNESFDGAERIIANLRGVSLEQIAETPKSVTDDRQNNAAAATS